MAHFAKLDENNKVLNVHVVNNSVILIDGVESEEAGIQFLRETHGHDNWKQTSYNKSFRKNFAAINGTYLQVFDAFIAPQPYSSWKLNHTTYEWEAPVIKPEDTGEYFHKWSEINKEWIQIAIPSIDS